MDVRYRKHKISDVNICKRAFLPMCCVWISKPKVEYDIAKFDE